MVWIFSAVAVAALKQMKMNMGGIMAILSQYTSEIGAKSTGPTVKPKLDSIYPKCFLSFERDTELTEQEKG